MSGNRDTTHATVTPLSEQQRRTPRGADARLRLVACDLDGVVWRGGEVLPGARKALDDVLRRGLDLRYVSNNSTAHRETVSERLARTGAPAGPERVLTSGFVTGCWLRERLPAGTPVLVVGEAGLMRELAEAGLAPRNAWETRTEQMGGPEEGTAPDRVVTERSVTPAGFAQTPAAVVVGMDRSFSFRTLARAQAAIRGGALFVATNLDPTFPTSDGLVPGAGALVAAVATAAGAEPVLVGKPGLALAGVLASVTGIPAAETLLVGDRLDTDIAMGHEAGMLTALVLTGVTSEADLQAKRLDGTSALPDYVLPGLGDLPALLDALGV